MKHHARLFPWPCYGAASQFTLPHLTSNPTCLFHYAERLYFEPNLQSAGEKTWGGCRSAQGAGAIKMVKKKSQRWEVKKLGSSEISADPSDISNDEAANA